MCSGAFLSSEPDQKGDDVVKKRILLVGIFLLIGFLVYVVGGALLPFVRMKPFQGTLLPASHFYQEGDAGRAMIAETGQEALDLRLSMFEEARERICITTFDIRPGQSTQDIFAALLEAADRGVKVQLIVDGMYGMIHMKQEPLFFAAGSHPNLEIRYYNPPRILRPWTINGRMHDKYVLVDDRFLFMGGRNMFDYFIGNYEEVKGLDREVLIYQTEESDRKVIRQVESYFKEMWENPVCASVFETIPGGKQKQAEAEKAALRERYEGLEIARVDWEKITVPISHAEFVHNPTHIYGKEPYLFAQLTELMKQAKKTVFLHTPYIVCSQDMYQGLSQVAASVPEFELLVNSIASGDNVCASADYMREKPKVQKIGASLYEYMGAHSTHGKSIAIDDDLSVIGSYNFDNRSTYVDTETMVVIHSQELNRQLREKFADLKAQSLQVAEDGSYIPREGVEENQMSGGKQGMIKGLSFVIRLVRYLV